ncbi:MAG: aminoglycoside phosphotransferase family protein [Candidatus Latescibacterota bacterium]
MTLDKQSIPAYLQRKRLLDREVPLRVQTIGDGMKNLVFLVWGSQQRWIVKQALAKVQVKERWWVDRKRVFAEKNCIEVLHQILPPPVIPEVVLEDRTDFVLVTTAPPDNAVLWDEELEGGRIDLQIAVQCGELLAAVHNQTAQQADVRRLFSDTKAFEQLRTEPLYLRVMQAYPDLKKAVNAQVRHLLKDSRTLVLADLRPRNVWLSSGQVFLVDFATAHFGSPSFDLAFYATDLCLKAMNNSIQKAAYLEAINVFWNAYFRIAEYPTVKETQKLAVADLGCLLLAATDGRQPATFAEPQMADLARRIAQSLLFTELERIEEITEFANRTLIDG